MILLEKKEWRNTMILLSLFKTFNKTHPLKKLVKDTKDKRLEMRL